MRCARAEVGEEVAEADFIVASESSMKICDRATAVVKPFNVAFYGGYAVWYFYCPLLLRWRGVPSGLIGVVLAVRPVVGAAVTPL